MGFYTTWISKPVTSPWATMTFLTSRFWHEAAWINFHSGLKETVPVLSRCTNAESFHFTGHHAISRVLHNPMCSMALVLSMTYGRARWGSRSGGNAGASTRPQMCLMKSNDIRVSKSGMCNIRNYQKFLLIAPPLPGQVRNVDVRTSILQTSESSRGFTE